MQKHSINEFFDLRHINLTQMIEASRHHMTPVTRCMMEAVKQGDINALHLLNQAEAFSAAHYEEKAKKEDLQTLMRRIEDWVMEAPDGAYNLRPKSDRFRFLAQFYDPVVYEDHLRRFCDAHNGNVEEYARAWGWTPENGWTFGQFLQQRERHSGTEEVKIIAGSGTLDEVLEHIKGIIKAEEAKNKRIIN